jgi:hypothetical protein
MPKGPRWGIGAERGEYALKHVRRLRIACYFRAKLVTAHMPGRVVLST